MKYVCTLFVVRDIKKSRRFYEDLLKQEVETDFGENIGFKGGFALHLKEHYANLIGTDSSKIINGNNACEMYFESENIETFQVDLDKYGVEYVHKIKEQPWHQRVIRFYDPDRHIIEVGESMESVVQRLYRSGKSIREINEMSLMPVPFIEHAIKMIIK